MESPVPVGWYKLRLDFLRGRPRHPDKQEVHVGQGRYLGLNLAPGGTDQAIIEHEHMAGQTHGGAAHLLLVSTLTCRAGTKEAEDRVEMKRRGAECF